MTGVKSPRHRLQQALGRADDHYATHTGTIRMIRAYAVYGTTVLGHYSNDRNKIALQFPPPRPQPSTPVKLQGQIRHAGYRTRYDKARRYNTKRQKPLPQQWRTCLDM
jgi:hypothetical protein